MKKSNLLKGVAAMAMGLAAVGCSHEIGGGEADLRAQIIAEYNEMFIKTFGKPASNQDWGFGGGTRAMFTETWSGVHTCGVSDWNTVLGFTVPSNAVDLTKGSFTEADKEATAFVIPATHNGAMNFPFNLPAGAKIYNSGIVTSISGNYNGVVTFYNSGTLTFTGANGGRHTVINIGTLTVTDYANIGELYNGGALVLERGHNQWNPNEGGSADIPNEMKIYSNGSATIEMPDGGDLKAVCDIHGTITVGDGKNLKIQNGTSKYICGIDATGTVENVDGPLQTSYVKADVFKFDGNPIYLLPGGHVDVTTLQVPNENCHFYGAANSTGLVEAVNYEFGNKNDFTHTFSSNIYFKVNGGYIKCDNCYAMGHGHYFNNVDEYLASDAHTADGKNDEYALAADRINAGNATGAPECGQPWTVGTPTTPVPNWVFKSRVFAEDLSVSDESDFDFNDVVFDVFYSTATSQTKIQLLAAGGTLPITVAGVEVHKQFGEAETTMINTGVVPGYKIENNKTAEPIILDYIPSSVDDIKIIVSKNNTLLTLEATEGKPAAKFAVPAQIKWCKERSNINNVYTKFGAWVEKPETVWYNEADYGDSVK